MTTEPFISTFVPAKQAGAPTLLLLHGTGGNEASLLDIGRYLAPTAALLGVRGKVLERGLPRYFRRLSEGVFDLDDLIQRTHELADWLPDAVTQYGFDPASLIAVGYSNGANIAASVMLLRPGVITRAVLLRAMLPLEPETPPDLTGTRALMMAGARDSMIAAPSVERLAALLTEAHAELTLEWVQADHGLTQPDITTAQAWIARETAATR
jgi:predicted esterase